MNKFIFGQDRATIEDVTAIARGELAHELSDDPEFLARIHRGADVLTRLVGRNVPVYGVTTGYGDSCSTTVPAPLVDQLAAHMYTFHGCGMGQNLSPVQGRAVLATRLQSLVQGYSGVTHGLLRQLDALLQNDITPVIPAEGSVGASGDLSPLSYVAAVLCGEREVYRGDGTIGDAASALSAAGMTPLRLQPKEGLAIMNGTAVMTGLACLALERAEYLAKVTTRITALMSWGIRGNAYHFDEMLFSVKPHPGQQRVAARLRGDLAESPATPDSSRLQDPYSLRCAPHVVGALEDALPWARQLIEIELNSANDNPIIDGEGEQIYSGGHFYGGHVAMAMDTLKVQVANLADLLDRQVALIADPKFNRGLAANLCGVEDQRSAINHGIKALAIGCSAWAAEALKNTMPASVFSRSTENHNQDKVSMGTIGARDCLRTLELTEQVAAGALFAACQGVELRARQEGRSLDSLAEGLRRTLAEVRQVSAFLEEDRRLEHELKTLVGHIQQRRWHLYQI